MKKIKTLMHGSALAVCLALAACSDNSSSGGGASAGEVKVVEIEGDDNMKFNITEFQVSRGQPVKVTLKNVGTMPKESMGHNFVVLSPEVDLNRFVTAAATQARNDYIPPQFQSGVLAATKLLGPGESETIEFTAPAEAGNYEFLCSFPGHAPAGMKGVMVVK